MHADTTTGSAANPQPRQTDAEPTNDVVPYFVNHDRRRRFPWSLYHRGLERRLARAVAALPAARPRVLVVGCGLEPFVPDVIGPIYYGADLDAASIATCRSRYPQVAERLADLANRDLEHRVADKRVPPHRADQVLLGHEFSGPGKEMFEHSEGLGPELDRPHVLPETLVNQVKVEGREMNSTVDTCWNGLADHGLHVSTSER